jgi:hypothetical protein
MFRTSNGTNRLKSPKQGRPNKEAAHLAMRRL